MGTEIGLHWLWVEGAGPERKRLFFHCILEADSWAPSISALKKESSFPVPVWQPFKHHKNGYN